MFLSTQIQEQRGLQTVGAPVASIDSTETTTVHTAREVTQSFQPELCLPTVTNGKDNLPFRVSDTVRLFSSGGRKISGGRFGWNTRIC